MSLQKEALSGMLLTLIQTFRNQFIEFGISIIVGILLPATKFVRIGTEFETMFIKSLQGIMIAFLLRLILP